MEARLCSAAAQPLRVLKCLRVARALHRSRHPCRLTPSPQAERVTPRAFHASVLSAQKYEHTESLPPSQQRLRAALVLSAEAESGCSVTLLSPFELGARRRPQWRRVRRWRFVPFFRPRECFAWVPLSAENSARLRSKTGIITDSVRTDQTVCSRKIGTN